MNSVLSSRHNDLQKVTLPPISEMLGSVRTGERPNTSRAPRSNAQSAQHQVNTGPAFASQSIQSLKRLRESSPDSNVYLLRQEFTITAPCKSSGSDRRSYDQLESQKLQRCMEEDIDVPNFVHDIEGWFDPACKYAQRMLTKIKGFSLEKLCDSFFFQDPNRPLYGQENHVRPGRRPMSDLVDNDDSNEQRSQEKQRNNRHSGIERDRRARHSRWQADSAAFVSELCYLASDEKLEEDVHKPSKTYRSQPRAPGKDDQLLATLFMLPLAAIIIQVLRAACRVKTNRIQVLEQQVNDLIRQNKALTRVESQKWPSLQAPYLDGNNRINTRRIFWCSDIGYEPPSPSPSSGSAEN